MTTEKSDLLLLLKMTHTTVRLPLTMKMATKEQKVFLKSVHIKQAQLLLFKAVVDMVETLQSLDL
jgi:hypothetical protein